MLKAIFRKKWDYGNPEAVDLEGAEWWDWLRFVNIAADDYEPGTEIFTGTDPSGNLYGYSHQIVDEDGIPIPAHLAGPISIVDAREAFARAEAEDWRIETHQDLRPIARRVSQFIQRQQDKHSEKERQILKILTE